MKKEAKSVRVYFGVCVCERERERERERMKWLLNPLKTTHILFSRWNKKYLWNKKKKKSYFENLDQAGFGTILAMERTQEIRLTYEPPCKIYNFSRSDVCVCVCVRERERVRVRELERERKREREREKERETEKYQEQKNCNFSIDRKCRFWQLSLNKPIVLFKKYMYILSFHLFVLRGKCMRFLRQNKKNAS